MESGSKAAAPGPLGTVEAFVNTLDLESQRDELINAEALRTWLAGRGLLALDDSVGEGDLHRAQDVREALRALLRANNGDTLDRDATVVLDEAAKASGLTVRFGDDGHTRLEPMSHGVDAALGRLLAIVTASMAEGTWTRLKACRDEGCWWAFYDHSKNHSGEWCSMAVCGNRNKTREYRRRRQGQAEA